VSGAKEENLENARAKALRYRELASAIRIIAEDQRGDSERMKLIAAAREFDELADQFEISGPS
jgi:hypothetical protein